MSRPPSHTVDSSSLDDGWEFYLATNIFSCPHGDKAQLCSVVLCDIEWHVLPMVKNSPSRHLGNSSSRRRRRRVWYQILWIYDGVATAKIWAWDERSYRLACAVRDEPGGLRQGALFDWWWAPWWLSRATGAADCSSVFLESFVKIWYSLWRPRFGSIFGMSDITSEPSI